MLYVMTQEKDGTDNSGSQEKNTPDPTLTSLVTASTWIQRADFFASKSLTAFFFKKLGYNEHPLATGNFLCSLYTL